MILSVASTPKSAVMRASSISASVASSSLRKAEKIFLRGAVKTSLVFWSPCLNFSMKPPNRPMGRDYRYKTGSRQQETGNRRRRESRIMNHEGGGGGGEEDLG